MRGIVAAFVLLVLAAAAPAQTWVSRYNGAAGGEDIAYAVGCDDSGRVYVTGTSWGTGNDFLTIAYGRAGESLWARRHDGAAHGSDEARAIAVRGGRVAVTGGSSDAGLFTDFLTAVYSAAGDTLWTASYDGPGNGNDHGLVVKMDDAGNVYAAGYALAESTSWDFATIKYDASGTRQWVGRFATEFEDFVSAMALDSSGNVYVTGSSGNPYLLTWDYTTVKYNAAGVEQWARQYNGPAGEDDEPYGIAVDDAGNVYVTGGSLDSTSGLDYATIKYGPAGDTLWVRRYNGTGNGPDEARAMALDAAGNVYITGSSQGATTDMDYATVKYRPDGSQAWVARYDGPVGGFDEARAIAVDDAGCAYVAGNSTGDGTRADYAVVKYDSAGGQAWVVRYDGPASRLDEAVAIALDGTGGIAVTGGSAGSGTGTDYATMRMPASGIAEPGGAPAVAPTRVASCIVRPGGQISYVLDAAARVRLTLHDASGRLAAVLADGARGAGRHYVRLPASEVGTGVYFARLSSGPGVAREVVAKVIVAE